MAQADSFSSCRGSMYMHYKPVYVLASLTLLYKLTFFPPIRVPPSFGEIIILYFFYIPHLIYLIRFCIYLILSIGYQRPFFKFLSKCAFSTSIVCDFWVSRNNLIKFHKICKSWVDTSTNTVRCLVILGILAGFEILSVTVSAAKQRAFPHICWSVSVCISSWLFRKQSANN